MRKGFTLIEMLVVIGIIVILIGASIGGYSRMTRTAEKAKAQELVSNVATALTVYFQTNGSWPKRLIDGAANQELNETVALPLAKDKYMSLTLNSSSTALGGLDRFGIVTPWATEAIKRHGNASGSADSIKVGTHTVKDHILHYALDLDGDGIVKGANVGGKSIDIRATAAVWCCGKDGVISAYPYAGGGSGGKGSSSSGTSGKTDDIYSWTPGQTKNVN